MIYKVKAYDRKNKVEVSVVALFLHLGKIVSVQTHCGVFPAERFELEIAFDLPEKKS